MATPARGVLVGDSYLEELARRAESLYTSELKALLEPEHNNEFVGIHVETRDYAVGANFREAKRIMVSRHGIDGKLVIMKIGPEPESDPLAYRTVNSLQKTPTPK